MPEPGSEETDVLAKGRVDRRVWTLLPPPALKDERVDDGHRSP